MANKKCSITNANITLTIHINKKKLYGPWENMLITIEDHSYIPQDPIIGDAVYVLQSVKATKMH